MGIKKDFKKLLKKLPESVDEVNEMLENEMVVMVDFMDGDRVLNVIVSGDQYEMLDTDLCEMSTVDLDHLLSNKIYK